MCFHPLIQERPRYVDVLPESFDRMAAQEKSVEKGGFPLRSQGIKFISRRHKTRYLRKCQYSRAGLTRASGLFVLLEQRVIG
jgi:hypothetical protein